MMQTGNCASHILCVFLGVYAFFITYTANYMRNSGKSGAAPLFRVTKDSMSKEFAKSLKQLMRERKISASELASAVGVSRSTLEDWLQGAKPRKLEQVRDVAKYLSVSFESLLFGEITEEKKIVISKPVELHLRGHYRLVLEEVTFDVWQKENKPKENP